MSNDGWSKVAKKVEKPWSKATKRPKEWVGKVYGIVVHTTGSGLPEAARKAGINPVERAVGYYKKSFGTHYVCGWNPNELIQVASEDESANGVGVTAQKDKNQKGQVESVRGDYNGSWEKDLPASLVTRWKERWKHTGAKTPLDLFPTKFANSCYVHVEMIPCYFSMGNKNVFGAEPMKEGLYFTKEQHDNVAKLAVDIAERNGWPEGWYRTGRLVTHEDISPISRHDKNGGWDPGVLRATPRFDWDYLIIEIGNILANKELVDNGFEKKIINETEVFVKPTEPARSVTLSGPVFLNPDKQAVRDKFMEKVKAGGQPPAGFLAVPGLQEPRTFWQKVIDFFVNLFKSSKDAS